MKLVKLKDKAFVLEKLMKMVIVVERYKRILLMFKSFKDGKVLLVLLNLGIRMAIFV